MCHSVRLVAANLVQRRITLNILRPLIGGERMPYSSILDYLVPFADVMAAMHKTVKNRGLELAAKLHESVRMQARALSIHICVRA